MFCGGGQGPERIRRERELPIGSVGAIWLPETERIDFVLRVDRSAMPYPN